MLVLIFFLIINLNHLKVRLREAKSLTQCDPTRKEQNQNLNPNLPDFKREVHPQCHPVNVRRLDIAQQTEKLPAWEGFQRLSSKSLCGHLAPSHTNLS